MCPRANEEDDIVVSGDKFFSDAREGGEGDGQLIWLVFKKPCAFDLMFDVGIIFMEKSIMKAKIKSRSIASKGNVKFTKK